MNYLVTGAQGQVGRSWAKMLTNAGEDFIALDRAQFNLEDEDQMLKVLNHHQPKVVVSCAAYTQVDKAETERERCAQINTRAPQIIAHWCAEHGAKMLHYSTDYVYPGKGSIAWRETDDTGPLNFYGLSKLQGEQAIQYELSDFLIFRTSWVYHEVGLNFVLKILKKLNDREPMKIVDDQIGAPTYAPSLAAASYHAIKMLLKGQGLPGVYNLCSSGEVSWFGFAQSIQNVAQELGLIHWRVPITKVNSSDFVTPATRPLNSRLDLTFFTKQFSHTPPHWGDDLRVCIKNVLSQRQTQ